MVLSDIPETVISSQSPVPEIESDTTGTSTTIEVVPVATLYPTVPSIVTMGVEGIKAIQLTSTTPSISAALPTASSASNSTISNVFVCDANPPEAADCGAAVNLSQVAPQQVFKAQVDKLSQLLNTLSAAIYAIVNSDSGLAKLCHRTSPSSRGVPQVTLV
ncbi:hypothetical protein CONLIGDRAFT_686878 [Coniochaeta ligniaria NRRL 30616]|uniref:Uncharacterized protein n=1 Tax=Coniochaeta ligniaria NRRL 30616 TaxID=1408157 RepID=A0A1J7J6I3_9PEZI|nr:hypothetical protein CONLIGDRAFT_686878 [Coniochaeta ligniaria NRRL 30616]